MRRTRTDDRVPHERAGRLAGPCLRPASALVVAAAALLAGCTAGQEQVPPSTSADVPAASQQYADCLRDQGLDVAITEDGTVAIQADPSSDGMWTIDPDDPLGKAQQLCQQQVPDYDGGFAVGSGDPDELAARGAAETPQGPDPAMQQVLLDFAACARENGFPDYPDPEPDQTALTFPDDLTGAQVASLWFDLCPVPQDAPLALALSNEEHMRALQADPRFGFGGPVSGGSSGQQTGSAG